MSKHVDLVVTNTKFGRRLFEAPNFSNLREGDKIKVDTRAGIVEATVIAVAMSEVHEGYNYNFIITACGATKPLRKVVSKITETEFEYPDEVEEEVEDESNDTDESDC